MCLKKHEENIFRNWKSSCLHLNAFQISNKYEAFSEDNFLPLINWNEFFLGAYLDAADEVVMWVFSQVVVVTQTVLHWISISQGGQEGKRQEQGV